MRMGIDISASAKYLNANHKNSNNFFCVEKNIDNVSS